MKKAPHIIAAATLAGMIFVSTNPSAEAASFDPVLAQPTSTFPFTDVPAERVEMVSALYQNKFFNGVSADKFGWDLPIKRVDAAMIAARGMGFRKGNSMPEEWLTFRDIPGRAKDAIIYLQFYEVVNGKTETLFGSNDMITRGEAAIILARAYNDVLLSPTETVHSFTDATGRYAEAINRLAATGIVNGKTPDRFGTNDPVTRGAFAMMVSRLSDPALSPSSYGSLPSSQDGLTMEVEKNTYSLSSDTGISLTLINATDFRYEYHHGYALEKKQGDKWLGLRSNYGISYPPIIPTIEAGESQRGNVRFDSFRTLMTAGEYRIRNTFYPWDSLNKEDVVSIAAYFTITE
ncbi:S-layer homology domain-containing protein [Domibacillus sp. PGB-M46]|uniref:S-layer homology domain-containing protein n=1 Tax=Domibacillus sp. PGB-M46 TaxID=2910255 RepID=UPI001F5A770D|nr:S-layer homology domain-containing protein [Domibacillus sp. PGB-M46]MCI2256517.1 S-layer homology domain-containing protein [Domibacillus sp. PGB-M46]